MSTFIHIPNIDTHMQEKWYACYITNDTFTFSFITFVEIYILMMNYYFVKEKKNECKIDAKLQMMYAKEKYIFQKYVSANAEWKIYWKIV